MLNLLFVLFRTDFLIYLSLKTDCLSDSVAALRLDLNSNWAGKDLHSPGLPAFSDVSVLCCSNREPESK